MSDPDSGRDPEAHSNAGRDSAAPSGTPGREPESAEELLRRFASGGSATETVETARSGAGDRRRRFWRRFLLFSAVFAVLVTLPTYLTRPGGSELDFPPDELLGTWTTDEARYADRSITVTPQEVRLGLGADGQTIHRISSIRLEVANIHREYTISYSGAEGDEVLELFVYDDESLRLRNPSEVRWTRQGP